MRGEPMQAFTTQRPIATKFPGHGCMDDLKTERSFDSKASWVIVVIGLECWHVIHECLYNQALSKIAVDWCRNLMATHCGVIEIIKFLTNFTHLDHHKSHS